MNDSFRYYALWLTGICFAVFIVQFLFPGFTELFLLDENALPEIWRFLTSVFLHGGIAHLFYNMFALALFGSILEKLIGSKKFLHVFILSGIIANFVSYPFYSSSLGASGAIFGIIGALIIVRPMLTVWAFGMPMPIFIAGILWAGGDVIGAISFLSGNPVDNTGNIAHLSGMVVGFLFGLLYRDWNREKIRKNDVYFDEHSFKRWEDDYVR